MNIIISLDEYIRLRKSEKELKLLEAGGVDNWNWYWESLNPDGEPTFDERLDKLEEEIRAKYMNNIKSSWYCNHCEMYLEPEQVTYEENCEICGNPVGIREEGYRVTKLEKALKNTKKNNGCEDCWNTLVHLKICQQSCQKKVVHKV